MPIKIEIYHQSNIAALRSDWERLQRGPEMTYFQTWEWNNMLLRGVPKDSWFSEIIFLVAKKSEIVEMILPLWIIKKTYRMVNKPCVYFLGQGGWSDYLTCIYDDFNANLMDVVMSYISTKFPTIPFRFSSLKDNSSLYRYIKQNYTLLMDKDGICVSLLCPKSIEEWWHSLSKNARQNLRTAKNRMARDGIAYIINFDDRSVNKQDCIAIRTRRSKMKATRDEKVSWIKKIKRNIKSKFCTLPSQGGYLPILDDPHAKIMTISTKDGDMMAYFHYGYDESHREIVVMSAGVVEQYERYSPGMILLQAYIEFIITEGTIDVLDFTRGDESYKFALGGIKKVNHTITFAI